jgi:hypothetical protein
MGGIRIELTNFPFRHAQNIRPRIHRATQGVFDRCLKEGNGSEEEQLAMAANARSPQERRSRYLKLAAEAETKANNLGDPKARAASIDLAVTWMMIASEISEKRGSCAPLFSGVPYWTKTRVHPVS